MNATRLSPSALRFAVCGALAMTLATGCTSSGAAPRADASASRAETALAGGKVEQAVQHAESAVERSPRDAGLRALLGHAYMRAGRFQSAATTFNDAMELGDNSSKTALSLALSLAASGRTSESLAILDDWRETIPASDLGLAYALAGEPSRGVSVLSDALRNGENTAKIRQNLAYSYAMDGRWREARLMMEQDVPADQVNDRISQWAAIASPESHQARVAGLIGAPLRADRGQPAALALGNTASAEQLAAETGALRPEPKPARDGNGELPAASGSPAPSLALAVPAVAPEPMVAPAPAVDVAVAGDGYVSRPVIQAIPEADARRASQVYLSAAETAPKAARARVATSKASVAPAPVAGSHFVQLGAFSSPQGARRAWGILAARNPELKNTRMAITHAVVNGKDFWRVAAAGLNAGSASGLCASVRTRGGACFAYAGPARGAAVGQQLARND